MVSTWTHGIDKKHGIDLESWYSYVIGKDSWYRHGLMVLTCNHGKQRILGPISWGGRDGLITEWQVDISSPALYKDLICLCLCLPNPFPLPFCLSLSLSGVCRPAAVFGCVKEVCLLCVWLYRVWTQSKHSLNTREIHSWRKFFLLDIN